MKNKQLISIAIGIIVFLLGLGISYKLFSNTTTVVYKAPATSAGLAANGQPMFDNSLPKTESCPINGAMYSKQQRSWWEQHRPLGIMIENHPEARPQSGLGEADAVYEAVAEGGITRFLSIFYCQDGGEVGPVRSARTYFIDFASEYGNSPLYAHVGGANQPGPADALSQLTDYGWTGYNDLNQFSIGFPTFWRDYDRLGRTVATEHTMYSTTSKLWDFAKVSRNLTNVDKTGALWDTTFVPYTFKDDASLSDRGLSQTMHIEFWGGYKDFFVDWKYDKVANIYKRNVGGVPNIDKDTNKQLTAKNVVVLSMLESGADDGYENNVHLLYQTTGKGKAYIFMDGKEIKGTWKKAKRISGTLLYDANGNAISFDRGTMWFEVLPAEKGTLTVQ